MKKFVSIILGIFITVLLFVVTAMFIVRDSIKANTIEKIATSITSERIEDIMEVIMNDSETDKEVKEIMEYLDDDEFSEIFSEYASDFLQFVLVGKGDKPDSGELEDSIIEAAEKYEKETGEDVDIEGIRNTFDELDNSMEEFDTEISNTAGIQEIFDFAFGSAYIAIFIIIIILLAIIYLLFKDIKPVLKVSSIALLSNGVSAGLLALIFSGAEAIDKMIAPIFAAISNLFAKYAIIYIVLAIVCIVVRTILKKRVKAQEAE